MFIVKNFFNNRQIGEPEKVENESHLLARNIARNNLETFMTKNNLDGTFGNVFSTIESEGKIISFVIYRPTFQNSNLIINVIDPKIVKRLIALHLSDSGAK